MSDRQQSRLDHQRSTERLSQAIESADLAYRECVLGLAAFDRRAAMRVSSLVAARLVRPTLAWTPASPGTAG